MSIAALALALLLPATAAPENPTARTEHGLVRGVREGAVDVYRGIPFAAPPVGERRWRPPEPLEAWEGTLDCLDLPPSCPQPSPEIGDPPPRTSEDCLYLNVWTPTNPGAEDPRLAPVMVWIHGGGYTTGSGSLSVYEGTRFARRGVVLVTINYRLGPFGFLAHPALTAESPEGTSGNYGLLDQVAALEWVRRNIRAFGGDPECVTVFGESAGAGSIGHLLVMPAAEGLFVRAILQSGHALGTQRALSESTEKLESAEAMGVRLSTTLGCEDAADPLSALRKIDATDLLDAADPGVGLFATEDRYWPVVDGVVLPGEPRKLVDAGEAHPVDVLLGTNATEADLFMKRMPVRTVSGYRWLLRKIFPDHHVKVLATFPADQPDQVREQISEITTLSAFVAPARHLARALEGEDRRVWLYHFTRISPGARHLRIGATHAVELPYVFGTLADARPRAFYDRRDRALSDQMMRYWVAFASSGNPNAGEDLPAWPEYRTDTDRHLELGDETRAGERLHESGCDLFDDVLYGR